jgi:hypothetical protein
VPMNSANALRISTVSSPPDPARAAALGLGALALNHLRGRLHLLPTQGDPFTRVGVAEDQAQTVERSGHHTVVDPVASSLAVDEVCLVQHARVVAHRRLCQAERVGQMTDASLAFGLGLDQAEDSQTRWIGQNPQMGGETPSGLFVNWCS